METRSFVDAEDRLVVHTRYDPTATIEANAEARALAPKHRVSNGKLLTKVMDIDEGHIVALKNLGYNILSPDPDEVKRALLYIQAEEKHHLTMPGNPIGKKKHAWA